MDSTTYIFNDPEKVGDIEIHPITMRYYDKFMKVANVLTLSYKNFGIDNVTDEIPSLLELVIFHNEEKIPMVISLLEKVFTFVCKQEVRFNVKYLAFLVGEDELVINKENYDEIRQVILRQNLIFSPPIYKNKLVQEWVDLALKARAQSSLKITNEAMITTISAFNGMDINLLTNYSYYQVSALFQRILKFKGYDTSVLFRSVGGEVPIDHFAEEIDLLKNPYSDVIKDSSHYKHIEDSISGKF